MQDQFEQVSNYPTLREDQRIEARARARANLLMKLGGEPQLAQYEARQWSSFGKGWEVVTLLACIVVLIAAFVISAIHIYNTGRDASLGINGGNKLTAAVIGGMLVLLAESAILALSLVPTVFNTPKHVTRGMYLGVMGSAFIAAVGNINATILYTDGPFDWFWRWGSAFATEPQRWALATLPPALTVLVGQGLKYYALSRSKERNEAKRQYDAAVIEWRRLISDIETHQQWSQAYANALWEQWRAHRPKAMIGAITLVERREIIRREMYADEWYEGGSTPQYVSQNTPVIQSDTSAAVQQGQTNQVQKVADYLALHPEDEALSFRNLADKVGVSHATIQRYRRQYTPMVQVDGAPTNGHRNGHSNGADSAHEGE